MFVFVCLQKDAKQCCNVTKLDCDQFVSQQHAVQINLNGWLKKTMSKIKVSGITALFGVFLGTKKHQNVMTLRRLVSIANMQSMSPHFITSPGPSPGAGPVRVL